MIRRRTILTSLRLFNSALSTGLPSTRPLFTQVTHFSSLLSPCSPLHQSRSSYYLFNTLQRKLCFSSKPNSIVDMLLDSDWSPELENELETSCPTLSHETVIYVLRKLDGNPDKALSFFDWACKRDGFTASSRLYSLLLRILASKYSMSKFWSTLKKMKEQGFYIDEETYQTISALLKQEKRLNDVVALKHFHNRMIQDNAKGDLVNNVIGVILKVDEWRYEVEKELEAMKIVVTDNFVIRVLKELRNYPSKAWRFFHWVGGCEDYAHNAATYNAVVRVLARGDSIGEFWNAVEEMKNADHEIDYDTYIKIQRQFQKNKLLEDAVKLYEFMMDGPFKPSIQESSLLLRSISASPNPDLNLVLRVSKKYEAAGYSLSKAFYDGMHRSFTSAGHFDEAENILKLMRNAGYEPDNITYSQLVFGLCKARRLEEACKVLDEMEVQRCVPDIKTWTILIQGHCAANEFDKAWMIFAKMLEKNCNADADLLDILVNGFLNQNRIVGAYTFLMEMVNKARLVPWQATYKLLIEKLLEIQKLEEAINLLHSMKKQNYPPFPEPFVRYVSKFGTVNDAVDFLNALSVKQYPSSSAYLHVLESFFKEGRDSEAKDLLFKFPHHIRQHSKILELFGSSNKTDDTTASLKKGCS